MNECANDDPPTCFITEPAFSMNQATCIWYLENSKWVKNGKPVKWLIDLDAIFNWVPNVYQAWATETHN